MLETAKKKRFLRVLGVVYKLFIIYIWGIEKNRGFYSLEKRPGREFLGACNGVIQNRYLKNSVQPEIVGPRVMNLARGSRFMRPLFRPNR